MKSLVLLSYTIDLQDPIFSHRSFCKGGCCRLLWDWPLPHPLDQFWGSPSPSTRIDQCSETLDSTGFLFEGISSLRWRSRDCWTTKLSSIALPIQKWIFADKLFSKVFEGSKITTSSRDKGVKLSSNNEKIATASSRCCSQLRTTLLLAKGTPRFFAPPNLRWSLLYAHNAKKLGRWIFSCHFTRRSESTSRNVFAVSSLALRISSWNFTFNHCCKCPSTSSFPMFHELFLLLVFLFKNFHQNNEKFHGRW